MIARKLMHDYYCLEERSFPSSELDQNFGSFDSISFQELCGIHFSLGQEYGGILKGFSDWINESADRKKAVPVVFHRDADPLVLLCPSLKSAWMNQDIIENTEKATVQKYFAQENIFQSPSRWIIVDVGLLGTLPNYLKEECFPNVDIEPRFLKSLNPFIPGYLDVCFPSIPSGTGVMLIRSLEHVVKRYHRPEILLSSACNRINPPLKQHKQEILSASSFFYQGIKKGAMDITPENAVCLLTERLLRANEKGTPYNGMMRGEYSIPQNVLKKEIHRSKHLWPV